MFVRQLDFYARQAIDIQKPWLVYIIIIIFIVVGASSECFITYRSKTTNRIAHNIFINTLSLSL